MVILYNLMANVLIIAHRVLPRSTLLGIKTGSVLLKNYNTHVRVVIQLQVPPIGQMMEILIME